MTAHPVLLEISDAARPKSVGFVTRVHLGHIDASGPMCTIGDLCKIEANSGEDVIAEVAKVDESGIVLVPLTRSTEISPDARIEAMASRRKVGVGEEYAGRIIGALGEPLDQGATIFPAGRYELNGRILKPLDRADSKDVLITGVKAIDGALTLARGQRVGIFAASGVGKTTLVRQLIDQVQADRCILCLVGERGKEVQAIWQSICQNNSQSKFTCVAATSDEAAALRVRAVKQALCLAEYWRDRGEHVLFLLDSVTRFAMALRDVGLAAGEPPTLRAYTPNVFAELPRLVERCGAAAAGGAITAVLTVLSETDDVDDPIVEVMKSLLDGHIVLSRQLAERGHFPAIDLISSVSRQAEALMSDDHLAAAKNLIANLSTYEASKVMIESGIYKKGSNPDLDLAIAQKTAITKFTKQASDEALDFRATVTGLIQIARSGEVVA